MTIHQKEILTKIKNGLLRREEFQAKDGTFIDKLIKEKKNKYFFKQALFRNK